jgi:hypothetical protein
MRSGKPFRQSISNIYSLAMFSNVPMKSKDNMHIALPVVYAYAITSLMADCAFRIVPPVRPQYGLGDSKVCNQGLILLTITRDSILRSAFKNISGLYSSMLVMLAFLGKQIIIPYVLFLYT